MLFGRWLDTFFGRGEAAVTVPPMDGPFLHNDAVDLMETVARVQSPDNLLSAGGALWFSDGGQLFRLDGRPVAVDPAGAAITALAASPKGLWIAREDGLGLRDAGGRVTEIPGGPPGATITAMVEAADGTLFLTTGSRRNAAGEWRRDLLERNREGAVWRRTADGRFETLLGGLRWAGGLLLDGGGDLVIAETWRHRLLRLRQDRRQEVLADNLPFYPSRLLASAAGGGWIGSYAGRGQLIEFVLRQHSYRRRMMQEVEEPWWIGPSFASGRSFLEPIRGGTVKRMGQTKAWAPSNSYGLAVRLDAGLKPSLSLHSRADGRRHGIMSLCEHDGHLWLASRGNGEIVRAPLEQIPALSRSQKERVQI